jgi:hypothetical protein
MRSLIMMLVMLLAAPLALADAEARRDNGDWVRITPRSCADEKVLANIAGRGENPLDYRAGRAEIGGTPYEVCWAADYDRQMYILRYDDMDVGELPFRAMRPVPEA